MSNKVSPVVKWMGGKTQVLPYIIENLPGSYNTYYEPFFGGGASLFNLLPEKAVINDINSNLINLYECIKNDVDKFIEESLKLQESFNNSTDKKIFYYSTREKIIEDTFQKAAQFLFLNKTCFNGIYRVNSNGKFNTPWNKLEKVNLLDESNVREMSSYLKNHVTIFNKSYKDIVNLCEPYDFCFLDPPYDPINQSGTKCYNYTSNGFLKSDQEELADYYKDLTNRGVYCMLCNHNTPLIQKLYKDYNIHITKANRCINCNSKGRNKVEEVLITNY